jgi:hypothetical protein
MSIAPSESEAGFLRRSTKLINDLGPNVDLRTKLNLRLAVTAIVNLRRVVKNATADHSIISTHEDRLGTVFGRIKADGINTPAATALVEIVFGPKDL